VPGKLNGCRADTSGSAIHEYFFTPPNLCSPEEIQRRCFPGGHGFSFIERKIRRLQCYCSVFWQALVLHMTAQASPGKCEHLVTGFEFGYIIADGLNFPASSDPRMGCLGPQTPRTRRAMMPKPTGIRRLRTLQSPAVTVVEYVRIRTSLCFGVGFAIGWPIPLIHNCFHTSHPELLGIVHSSQSRLVIIMTGSRDPRFARGVNDQGEV
jgi:hypothetical protein